MAQQTNLPYDIETPNRPNGVDESRIPVTTQTGEANPPDPMNTLLPNSTKYVVPSNQFLAIPLAAGTYNVRAREEGQVIYVASTADANATLRITKSFDIETVNRTAIYVKGQSVIDLLFKDLEMQVSAKRDIADSYSQEETEALINLLITQKLAGLTNVMQFKGTVDSEEDLEAIPENERTPGDVYQVIETGVFWVVKEDLSWEALSGTFFNLDDYYNKEVTDFLLSQKADKAELEKYKAMVENFIPTFDWQQTTDPSIDDRIPPTKVADLQALNQVDTTNLSLGTIYYVEDENKYYGLIPDPDFVEDPDDPDKVRGKVWEKTSYDPNWTDPTQEGQTWFNPENGMIYLRKRSQLDGGLFWLNSLENYLMLPTGNKFVMVDTAQTITGLKTFDKYPLSGADDYPTQPKEFVTKEYVDGLMANGAPPTGGTGGNTDLTGVAKLAENNTFTAENIFENHPKIAESENLESLEDNALITKENLEEGISGIFDTNPSIQNPKDWDNLDDNQLITKGILSGYTGEGGNATPSEDLNKTYARLHYENTFSEYNHFAQAPELQSDPVSGNDAVRMSFLDNRIQDVFTQIANDYYDKTGIANLLQDYLKKNEMANFLTYKGVVDTYANLLGKPDPQIGDVWYVMAPELQAGFYIFTGTSWDGIGNGISINDANYAKLSQTDNIFTNNNEFRLEYQDQFSGQNVPLRFLVGNQIQVSPSSLTMNNNRIVITNDFFKVMQNFQISSGTQTNIASFESGDITFNTNPLLTRMIAFEDLLDSHLVTKFQVNRLINAAGGTGGGNVDTTNLAKLNESNTFLGHNIFTQSITLTVEPTADTDAVNKGYLAKYVNDALAGLTPGGPTIDTTDFARLSQANTFLQVNTFNLPPSINLDPTNGNDAVRKSYLDTQIANKADANDVYTRLEADNTFVKQGSLLTFMEYKGTVRNYSNLPPNANVGDVYEVLEAYNGNTEGFYLYDGANWDLISSSLIDIDTSDLAKLSLSNTFTGERNEFKYNPYITTPQANSDNQLITKGEVNNLGYVKDTDNTTFTGNNVFQNPLTVAAPTSDNHAINKFYAEQNYVTLDTDQTIIGNKQFLNAGSLQLNYIPINNTDAVNKEYVDQEIADKIEQGGGGAGGINENEVLEIIRKNFINSGSDEPDIDDAPEGFIWIKTSYEKTPDVNNSFDDIPAIYIKVKDGWWDLHKEALL